MAKDSDKFIKMINELKEKDIQDINVIVHDGPDPDAFGSAEGVVLILKHFGINSRICYSGEISHPQNKTIVNVLNITAEKMSEKIDGINICVDCTPQNSCAKEALCVFDHHKMTTKAKYQFIYPNMGACATIVWKMIKELEIELPKENHSAFTSLLLGIRTDTNDLISDYMTKDDFVAYQELLELADKEALQKVMNYPFPRYLYDKRLVLHKDNNSYESNGVFVGGIGNISSTQRDVIAILAEEYARMESVTTAIIFAIIDKKSLEVSVRSTNVSLDVKQMCKDLFGDFGGGSSYKGGAKIPLGFYGDIKDEKNFWDLTCRNMFDKVFKENWIIKEEKK